MESHADQPEMGRFLQLAPEVFDEVFEDARILVELQKRVFVLFLRWNCSIVAFLVRLADHTDSLFRVVLVVDQQQLVNLFHIRLFRFLVPALLSFVWTVVLCHNFLF